MVLKIIPFIEVLIGLMNYNLIGKYSIEKNNNFQILISEFEDIDQNGLANKVLNKIRTEFVNELNFQQKKNLNFDNAQK